MRTDNTGLINETGLVRWRKGGDTKVQLVTAFKAKPMDWLVAGGEKKSLEPQGKVTLKEDATEKMQSQLRSNCECSVWMKSILCVKVFFIISVNTWLVPSVILNLASHHFFSK